MVTDQRTLCKNWNFAIPVHHELPGWSARKAPQLHTGWGAVPCPEVTPDRHWRQRRQKIDTKPPVVVDR